MLKKPRSIFIYAFFRIKIPAAEKTRNVARFTTTTLAPVGIDNTYESTTPKKKHTTETAAEHITTPLKLLNTRIDVSAGKIIRLEISIVPIILMPTTMVSALRMASSML